MKKTWKLGMILAGFLLFATACGTKTEQPKTGTVTEKTEQENTQNWEADNFLGDAMLDEDGTLSRIGEAQEGWESFP